MTLLLPWAGLWESSPRDIGMHFWLGLVCRVNFFHSSGSLAWGFRGLSGEASRGPCAFSSSGLWFSGCGWVYGSVPWHVGHGSSPTLNVHLILYQYVRWLKLVALGLTSRPMYPLNCVNILFSYITNDK